MGLAFVRIKRVDGKEYYQLVESRRVDGKPRQKVLLHLGQHEGSMEVFFNRLDYSPKFRFTEFKEVRLARPENLVTLI